MRKAALLLIALSLTLNTSIVYCQPNYKKQDRCREEDIPHYTAYKIADTHALNKRTG